MRNMLRCGGLLVLLMLVQAGTTTAQTTKTAAREKAASQPTGQNQVDVHHYLPKGSRIVVSVADFQGLMQALRKTPLYQLLQEPEMQPLFKKVTNSLLGPQMYYDYRTRKMKKRKNAWDRAQALAKQLTGFTVKEGIQIFRGPHALSIVGVPRGSSPLEMAGAFGVDDPQKAWQLLHTLLNRVPIRKTAYAYKGVSVKVLRGLENQFHYALHQKRILIATTQGVMQKMLDNGQGGQDHMGNDAGFQRFIKTAALPKAARVYIAADDLLQDLAANMGASRNMIVDLLGLKSWKSIGLAIGLQGERFHTRFHVRFKKGAEVTGPSRLFALAPADNSLLETFPTNTIAATLVRIPWVKLYDDAMAAFQKTSPRKHARMIKQLGQLERAILRDKLRDLIAAIGESSAFYVYPYASGGLIPQMTLVAKLGDTKKIQNLINNLAQQLNIKIKQQEYQGASIYILQLPRNSYRAMRRIPRNIRPLAYALMGMGSLQVCYRFAGDRVWIALSPQTMRNFIDRQQANPNPARTAMLKRIVAESNQAGAWTYFDPKQALIPMYNTLMGALPFIGKRMLRGLPFGRGLTPALLPRSEVLTRHMHPAVASAQHTDNDTLMKIRSGLGMELIAIAGIAAPIAGKLFLQFRIKHYIRSMVRYLELERLSKEYKAKGLYALAIQRWKRYNRFAMTDAIRLSTQGYIQQFEALAKAREKVIVNALDKQYKAQAVAIQEWKLNGDWTWQDGVLKAIPYKGNQPSLFFGAQKLSTYVLQFEVRNPTEGFSLSLHSQPNATSGGYSNYKSARKIYFAKKRFQQDQWVPVKIKVKGQRISYWFGLKHYKIRAYPKHGQIGFLVPSKGDFALRNLQLKVPQNNTPAVAQKLYPSLQIALHATASSIELGDSTSYRLTIYNQGQLPAKQLAIRLQLSKHIQFTGLTATPALTRETSTDGGNIVFAPITALEGGQTLRLDIKVRGQHAGSALGMAAIKFSQMQGEIAVSARLHVTPQPSKAAMAPTPTKKAAASEFGTVKMALRTRGRTNTGRTNTGRTNTGRTNTGRTNTGRTNTGRANTGRARANTGRTNTGRIRTGRTNTGRANMGRTKTARPYATGRTTRTNTRNVRGARNARPVRAPRHGRVKAPRYKRPTHHASNPRRHHRGTYARANDIAVYGRLSRGNIQQGIRAHIRHFRYCYEKQLLRNPRLAGRVKLRFQIDADGIVRSASVAGTTLANSRVERCLLRQIRATRFPRPHGGGIVIVNYPFIFGTN